MRHFIHKPSPTGKYKAILLIKDSSFNKEEIEKHYINPLVQRGYNSQDIFSATLAYNDQGKAPAKFMKEYLQIVLQVAKDREVTTLFVADTGYFKQLTKLPKAEPHYGYIKPCAIDGYKDIKIILGVNYGALFYNPSLQNNLDRALDTMMDSLTGFHIEPGTNIIHSSHYCTMSSEIEPALKKLHEHDVLVVDIETRGLQLNKSMLGTIGFAWDKHNGIVIDISITQGPYIENMVRTLLKNFFMSYKGKCIYHGATFDIKVLIFELFMEDWQDKSGMMRGLEVMTKNIDCTKIITYLATNSTSGNKLDLKSNAAEFAGNYAQEDIEAIDRIPLPDLYKYNLVDCLSTWFVYDKYWPKVLDDNQENVYREVLQPSIKLVVQMELVGMPLDENQVFLAQSELQFALEKVGKEIFSSQLIIDCHKRLKLKALILKNNSLKKKVIEEDDFNFDDFNPNSNKQVAYLLHTFLDLDVIDLTPTKQPSVGASTLKKHLNQLISKYNLTDEDLL